ncbi:hypothetical protein OG559_15285 [Micromonospora sp. NBC_01405]|uniref:hypothetical protein n=1 Tax=Micromonospora sp. NBC_01405 TaxID=2903589 RepID=UPI00324A19C4
MNKSILGFFGATMIIAATLAAPSAASADPAGEIVKCWQPQTPTWTIPKSQYYTCVFGRLHVYRASDMAHLASYDGNCANGVWVRNHSATFFDMTQYCAGS